MRGTRKSAAALLAFSSAFALTPMASAQEPVKPEFSFGGATVFGPGNGFTAKIEEGTCPGGPVSLTSPGFASVDLARLSGTVVTTTGQYTATLKCKDTTETGTLGFTVEWLKPPRNDPFLDKAEYAPGETIRINLEFGFKCLGEATSAGFTAPAKLANAGNGRVISETTAIATPGTYEAAIFCANNSVVNQFTIKAAPAAPPPQGTPAPKPKPPIVKPKGAPQTGGGGTA
ncbi:hypothetical protein ABZ345_21640 [Lentzea sp. NPDC005914]|uniref:hypothetical protein n=1 Tax=Lentzea sp. NPDC005914 TaxID=3154572 RepID=UPI0033D3F21F